MPSETYRKQSEQKKQYVEQDISYSFTFVSY